MCTPLGLRIFAPSELCMAQEKAAKAIPSLCQLGGLLCQLHVIVYTRIHYSTSLQCSDGHSSAGVGVAQPAAQASTMIASLSQSIAGGMARATAVAGEPQPPFGRQGSQPVFRSLSRTFSISSSPEPVSRIPMLMASILNLRMPGLGGTDELIVNL